MNKSETCEMKIIAHIHSPFPEKFGIPRQSGLAKELLSEIIFTPPYRVSEAVRGLEDYSHIWILWEFSQAKREDWSPTVRPPRLGGNTRMGVFATRSPFRPNPIGLSSVILDHIERSQDRGPVLFVRGADLMDGTPIYDIKPYLAFTDSHPDAAGGFADAVKEKALELVFPDSLLCRVPQNLRAGLCEMLREDPRPSYQNDPLRLYGFAFGAQEIHFTAANHILTVTDVTDRKG